MKYFFKLGDRYAENSTWKDFALTKFCLCAMGVIIGVIIPQKYKKQTVAAAGGVFAATYIPLMTKVFRTIREMKNE